MAQGSGDFEALARQYWGMWGDAMRGAAPQSGAEAGMQGLRDALGAWTKAAGGGQGGFDNVLQHFNRQNGDWFAQMQQVAAQFAGRWQVQVLTEDGQVIGVLRFKVIDTAQADNPK